MATSYTSNKKIGALDSASTPLAATNEIVINQNGDILKTPLSAVEAKVFDAKSPATTSPTGTEVVVIRKTDNSLSQVALADIVPALNITNAKVNASAAIEDTKLATINTAGKVTNNAVQATALNTADRIVARDGSGNFAAGTITATLSGNATTATLASSVADGSISTAKLADGAVSLEKLIAAVQEALVPVGGILPFGRTTAPSGWLACDGQAVIRTGIYAALFAAIGTTWGAGNGSTTFNVPDLRDRFLRHKGATYSGSIGATQADQVKSHTHTASTGSTGAHTHSVSGTAASDGAHTHSVSGTAASAGAHTHDTYGIRSGRLEGGGVANSVAELRAPGGTYNNSGGTSSNGAHTHSVSGTAASAGAHTHSVSGTAASNGAHTHTVTVDSTGGTENRPYSATVLYCIKF